MNQTEGEDYYLTEDGKLVFTEVYHLKRGRCCGNGCRHCPYNFENVREPKRCILLAQRQVDEQNKKGG